MERDTPKQIRISVADTGIGIKPQHQSVMFKVFGKVDSDESNQLNTQGVGLGLIISN